MGVKLSSQALYSETDIKFSERFQAYNISLDVKSSNEIGGYWSRGDISE